MKPIKELLDARVDKYAKENFKPEFHQSSYDENALPRLAFKYGAAFSNELVIQLWEALALYTCRPCLYHEGACEGKSSCNTLNSIREKLEGNK